MNMKKSNICHKMEFINKEESFNYVFNEKPIPKAESHHVHTQMFGSI